MTGRELRSVASRVVRRKPRQHRGRSGHGAVALLVAVSILLLAPAPARADDTITRPGDHPKYSVEIEPHLLLGWDWGYPGGGWGVGARFSIPVVDNGFVTTINNSVAVTFGVDAMFFNACWYDRWYNQGCTATFLNFPVAAQWNFFVARRWSVFGELGLMLNEGFFNGCPPSAGCGPEPPHTEVYPVLYLGGRYHLTPSTALTLRIGFPSFSFGFSFMP